MGGKSSVANFATTALTLNYEVTLYTTLIYYNNYYYSVLGSETQPPSGNVKKMVLGF